MARVGVTVQNEEKGMGRAGQAAQVDHAAAGRQRTSREAHAVDVDQLKAEFPVCRIARPKNISLVAIFVFDTFCMYVGGEACEGFQYGRGLFFRKAGCRFGERSVIGVTADIVTVVEQPMAAVRAPGDRCRRVDPLVQ